MIIYGIELKADQDDDIIIFISSKPSKEIIEGIKDVINENHEDENWTYDGIRHSIREFLKNHNIKIIEDPYKPISFDMDSFN
ncbi:hypothetical protein LCGC14_0175630 [marine sediment metagenome]|uniref:Uncharacterized protein n=1 Tax=marine sediment metagenome TaxID=412755 RepID=A0A0F9UVC6_9ZZZZ